MCRDKVYLNQKNLKTTNTYLSIYKSAFKVFIIPIVFSQHKQLKAS